MANKRKENPEHAETTRQVKAKKQVPIQDDRPVAESQEVATFQKFIKKPKSALKEIEQFKAKVSNDQKRLRALLQQRLQQAREEHARRRESISALIEQAFRPSSHDDTANADFESYPGTSIATNTIYKSVADVFASSKEMVQDYDAMEKKIADKREKEHKLPIAKDWENDVRDIQRKLELGRRTALRQVKKVLGAEVVDMRGDREGYEGDVEGLEGKEQEGEEEEEEEEEREEEKDENKDEEEKEEKEEEKVDDGLYMALRYAERGVRRMVKALPKDEMEIY